MPTMTIRKPILPWTPPTGVWPPAIHSAVATTPLAAVSRNVHHSMLVDLLGFFAKHANQLLFFVM